MRYADGRGPDGRRPCGLCPDSAEHPARLNTLRIVRRLRFWHHRPLEGDPTCAQIVRDRFLTKPYPARSYAG